MPFSKFALVGALASVAQVAAHGTVTGIVAGGTFFPGYSPNFQYQQVQPIVVGWSIPQDQDNGFIAPSAFGNPDVICHKGATNAQTSAPIAAGGEVELQWSVWPASHKGPVINYLANCGGDCTKVDKTTLKWFKIAESGLIDGSVAPGKWASDELIANNNSQTITIPSNIAAGNYVLRHEIIALHSAGQADGAQAYPQCINLEITGGGSAAPAGVLGTALYTATDPGILVNIYQTLTSYTIPGPALFSGSGSTAPVASSAAAPASTVAASTSVVASVILSTGVVAPVTSLPHAAVTSSAPTFTGAPFSNATSTRTRSAKKTRTANTKVQATATSVALPEVVSTTQIDVQTELKTSTVAASNPEATATVAPTPVNGNTPATTAAVPSATASVKAMPAGTTLTELLTWLKDMVTDILGGNSAAISKRAHARDLASAQ